jgi:hypothetical protein
MGPGCVSQPAFKQKPRQKSQRAASCACLEKNGKEMIFKNVSKKKAKRGVEMEMKIFVALAVAVVLVMQMGIGAAQSTAQLVAQEGEACAGIANIQCASGLTCTGVGNYPDASGVCKKDAIECTTLVRCAPGYESYFSGYDSNGCKIFGCRKADSNYNVDVSINVQPQQVDVYNSFQVYGKITYNADSAPTSDRASGQKQFTVVTSYSDYDYALSAKKSGILFASSESVLDKVLNIFGSKRQETKQATAEKIEPAASVAHSVENKQESGAYHASESAQTTAASVSAVAATTQVANAQERVDYITLGTGQTAEVSAYFTAQTPGTKLARITVYSQEPDCPSDPKMDRACKMVDRQVAQASAKISVGSETAPPQPPQDEATGTMVFHSGWNMVSVPVSAKVPMADVAASCGTASQAWRLGENGYVMEDTLTPGYGYWVKGTRGCKYEVKGDSSAQSLAALRAGWNLVGAFGRAVAFSEISGSCSATAGPWHYNTEQKQYDYSSSLQPGEAYWVKVGGACKLGFAYEDKPPAPPQ